MPLTDWYWTHDAKQAGFDAITIEGYNVHLHQGDKLYAFGLGVDPGKSPKAMDLLGGKTPLPCIYLLEGDRLRLALPASGKDGFIRPETLDTAKTKALVLNAEREK